MQVQAEGPELGGQVSQGHDLIVGAVDLQAVVVDDDGQVIQMIVGRCHEGLPNLALLALAVAQQGIDLAVLMLHLGTQGHAHGDGTALAQGAGGGVHAGDLLAVGENAVELAEILELIPADEAHLRQDRIVAGGRVALAQHETVPIGVVRVLRIHMHVVEKQASHQVCRRQGTTGVAAVGVGGHVDDIPPDLLAHAGKLCRIHEKPPYKIITSR